MTYKAGDNQRSVFINEGRAAHAAGKSMNACPYHSIKPRNDWLRGWKGAETAKLMQRMQEKMKGGAQ